jgi:hypothetical protein
MAEKRHCLVGCCQQLSQSSIECEWWIFHFWEE